jgi:hypothetical protein
VAIPSGDPYRVQKSLRMSQLLSKGAWFGAGPQTAHKPDIATTFKWPVSGAWGTPDPGEHRTLGNTRRGAKGRERVGAYRSPTYQVELASSPLRLGECPLALAEHSTAWGAST